MIIKSYHFYGFVENSVKYVKVKINCTIKDADDAKFVDKKLPATYVYDKNKKEWFFEP